MSRPDPSSRPLGRRLVWFVGLWAAGIGTVTLVSLLLRFWIGPH